MSYQYYNPQHDMSYKTPQQSEEQKQPAANSEQDDQSQQQNTEIKKPHKINIAQILVDFKNTIASIGASAEIEQKVNEYVAMVEDESKKESPRQASIVTNLKTASKLLDDYISGTLGKPSNVVQDWIDAFLLQEVDYKADEVAAQIPASKQIEAQIEQTNPELKEQFQGKNLEQPSQSAAAQYNQYSQNINYKNQNVNKSKDSTAQKSIEANELKEEVKQEAPKKKARKFARPDGKIIQGGKIIGEKTDDGQIKKYDESQKDEHKLEVKKVSSEKSTQAKADKAKKQKQINKKPKIKPISKDVTTQKFYEKSQEYLEKGDAQKALDSYRKTLNYAKKNKDKRAQAHIIQGMGESYNKLNNLAKATKCYYKASQRTKNVNLKADSHHGMGAVYDEVGKYDLAMDHYFESLSLNGEGDNPTKQANTLNKIGMMHSDRYMTKEAIDFYKLSLTMAKQNQPDIKVMGEVLENTASVFKSVGKPQKALKYYQKAIVCEQRVDNKEAVSKTYEKAADLMLEMKKPAKAANLYKKAMQEALLNKDSEMAKSLKQKMNLLEKVS